METTDEPTPTRRSLVGIRGIDPPPGPDDPIIEVINPRPDKLPPMGIATHDSVPYIHGGYMTSIRLGPA